MPGIYIHIPFCETKCIYCDFYSIEQSDGYDDFLAALHTEISRRAASLAMTRAGTDAMLQHTPEAAKAAPLSSSSTQTPLTSLPATPVEAGEISDSRNDDAGAVVRPAGMSAPPPPVRFHSVFFGGGTPSLLTPSHIGMLLETLHRHFPVAADAEISMECNPGTIDTDKLLGYRQAGVNRLSFGVQSFHEDDLRFLSRIHSVDDAGRAIAASRAAGFDNVNIDLMFSLPDQTTERWMHNLRMARELGTTHLSCYSLTVEKGTPLFTMLRRGAVSMPADESDALLFELTMDTLSEWGFRQYEVSNYALPGYECRHNLGYWRHEDYLGFGPSAHSAWDGRRFWNVSSVKAYNDAIQRGDAPEAGGETLTKEVLREEYLYLRLRSEGLDLDSYKRNFERDLLHDNQAIISRCLKDGLLDTRDGRLRLTRKGLLLCDEIITELL
jgi:oxygen-independent coproporphyrinogen III oxidase